MHGSSQLKLEFKSEFFSNWNDSSQLWSYDLEVTTVQINRKESLLVENVLIFKKSLNETWMKIVYSYENPVSIVCVCI